MNKLIGLLLCLFAGYCAADYASTFFHKNIQQPLKMLKQR